MAERASDSASGLYENSSYSLVLSTLSLAPRGAGAGYCWPPGGGAGGDGGYGLPAG